MIPLAGLLASPLARKAALYGGAALALGWIYRTHTNKIAEEAYQRGRQKQAIESAEAFHRAEVQQREALAKEKATVAEDQATAAGERAAAAKARETMRSELRASLGALQSDLRRGHGAAVAVPASDLDDAIRSVLADLRAGGAAPAGRPADGGRAPGSP